MINLSDTQETKNALNQIVSVLRAFGNYLATAFDTSGRQRVNVETGSVTIASGTVTTVTTVTGVTTVATVTNQTNIGSWAAIEQIPALMNSNARGLRSGITVT